MAVVRRWDSSFEQECHGLVELVAAEGRADAERDAAWRALLIRVAPFIEAWAAASPVLARCDLRGEDEVRSVLVGVIARLRAGRFANLQAFLARQPTATEDDDEHEAALVQRYARLGRLRAGDADAATPAGDAVDADDVERTPLRGWLRALTRYAVKDHVKQRFGWTSSARVAYGLELPRGAGARHAELEQAVRAVAGVIAASLEPEALCLAVELLPGTARPAQIQAAIEAAGYRIVTPPDLARSKRDLATGAERLDAVAEPGARPAITDALTLSRLLADVSTFMETFPAPMREAVRLWLDDEPFEAIAERLGLDGVERGRALVRAGVARLRERYRGQWPALFEG